MPKVVILLAPMNVMAKALFTKDAAELIKENLPHYVTGGMFRTPLEGEDAAEEAFDLTNNPSRQNERDCKYGRGRSVSSGDVIEVEGVDGKERYACLSFGWAKL